MAENWNVILRLGREIGLMIHASMVEILVSHGLAWILRKDVVLAVLYKVYFVIRVILVGTNSKSKVTSSHTTPRFWKPENPVTFCGLSLNKSVSDYWVIIGANMAHCHWPLRWVLKDDDQANKLQWNMSFNLHSIRRVYYYWLMVFTWPLTYYHQSPQSNGSLLQNVHIQRIELRRFKFLKWE